MGLDYADGAATDRQEGVRIIQAIERAASQIAVQGDRLPREILRAQ